jgi:Ran GTPase-activating protein (RanGAP) involved in mRNA processing and transport
LKISYLQNQAKYFIDKIKLSTQGKNFNLSDQSLGLYSAQLFNSILKNNNHFIKMDLGKNNFGDEGVKFISEILLFNRNIIHADFSSNNLTEQGVRTICDAVGQNNTLVSLNLKSFEGLNRNKIGAKGSVHLKKLLGRTKASHSLLSDSDVPQPVRHTDRSDRPQERLRRPQGQPVPPHARRVQ